MVQDVLQSRIPAEQAATHYGVSPPTVRKWVGRYLAEGQDGLRDRSSRPAVSPRSIDANKALTIIELRKKRMTQARIAEYMGVSKATVSRILKLAGMSQMRDLEAAPIIQRYEHAHPGDLLHFDTKKLGLRKWGIASLGIEVGLSTLDGRYFMWPSMIMPAWPLPKYIRTKLAEARSNS